MKIHVGRRLIKIRFFISTFVRFRRLIHRLVRKVSSLRSPDRTPRNSSFLSLLWPLGARTRDPAALNRRRRRKLVPKGCVAVYVGEERHRFVIPIFYLSHPFMTKILAEAEREFGYDYGGPLTVPCNMDDFEQVIKWLIDREKTPFQENIYPTFGN